MTWEILLHDLRPEILIRLGLALVAGFFIGAEREAHGRAAGLRTTLLVCLSACVAMIVSDAFYAESFAKRGPSGWHPDPARLAAGILAGMGFLGAGVILHERANVVRGVTTAATLWFAAIIGLTFGAGSLGLGIVATLSSLVILGIIPRFEDRMDNDWFSELSIHFDSTAFSVQDATRIVESLQMRIKGIDWRENLLDNERVILFHVKYKKSERMALPEKSIAALSSLPNVKAVHWHG